MDAMTSRVQRRWYYIFDFDVCTFHIQCLPKKGMGIQSNAAERATEIESTMVVECFSGLAPETHVFEVWVHGSKVAEVNFSNVHLFFAEKISSHFLCGFLAKRARAAPPTLPCPRG